jgi:hypothetical protein
MTAATCRLAAVSREQVSSTPPPGDATRLASILRDHPHWSVFWDKKYALWRAAEDDPDSALYTESPDVGTVIGYITAHT